MKKILRTTLAVSIALALTACNNGGVNSPETLDLSGKVVKGLVKQAQVTAYKASDPTKTVLDSTRTDDFGIYDLTIPTGTGPVVIDILADANTSMTCDATKCGELDKGADISDIAGLKLSTITNTSNTDVTADITAFTTLATDSILASVAIADEDDDGESVLSGISDADFVEYQLKASKAIGALLSIDLSNTNLFAIDIPDASVAGDVSTTDAILTALTVINASFSSLEVADDSTLAAEINTYVDAIEEISIILIKDAAADVTAVPAFATIQSTQAEIADEIKNIVADIVSTTGVALNAEAVLSKVKAEIDTDKLKEVFENTFKPTGATGTTGAN